MIATIGLIGQISRAGKGHAPQPTNRASGEIGFVRVAAAWSLTVGIAGVVVGLTARRGHGPG